MSNADRDWAYDLYETLARGGADERMFYLEVAGDPWSKSRPRFARGRAYQPRDDLEAEQKLASYMDAAANGWQFPGNVALACRFYRSNFQRIDADNLLKHVCDSANGVLWADDSQVTLIMGEVHYDAENPRTVIVAGNHASTLARGIDFNITCEHCGVSFRPANQSRRLAQRFCKDCVHAARVTSLEPIDCRQCGKSFKRTTARQVLCSRECRAAEMTGRNRSKGTPAVHCEECGKELSHKRGGRCRDCWKANPNFYGKEAS